VATKDLKIKRGTDPTNEFGENNELLYQALLYVFLFGEGLNHKGSMSITQAKHLLMQYNRAAALPVSPVWSFYCLTRASVVLP